MRVPAVVVGFDASAPDDGRSNGLKPADPNSPALCSRQCCGFPLRRQFANSPLSGTEGLRLAKQQLVRRWNVSLQRDSGLPSPEWRTLRPGYGAGLGGCCTARNARRQAGDQATPGAMAIGFGSTANSRFQLEFDIRGETQKVACTLLPGGGPSSSSRTGRGGAAAKRTLRDSLACGAEATDATSPRPAIASRRPADAHWS